MLAVFPFELTIKADLLVRIRFEAKTIIAACSLQFILKLNRIGIQLLLACKLLFDAALYKDLSLGVAFSIFEVFTGDEAQAANPAVEVTLFDFHTVGHREVFTLDPVVSQLSLGLDEEVLSQTELLADFGR